MGKKDLRPATISDFFWWINERHRIWVKRSQGLPPPWTDDEVLRTWKFTNAFRELDRGTLALRAMNRKFLLTTTLRSQAEVNALLIFNTIWYRLLNWHEHAVNPGFITEVEVLSSVLRGKEARGEKIFTAAHMTVGKAGEAKIETNLRSFKQIWDHRFEIEQNITTKGTMEGAFDEVRRFYGIGSFIGYEIACDLRFELGICKDALTWANIGPGCKRGLQRLGMPVHLDSLLELYKKARVMLESHVREHYIGLEKPPFELREIEHSLCEFDKYQRALHGTGRPKQYFEGGR